VQFERLQKFSDKPLTRCPECRTGRVKRIPQPPAVVFKGSGWYVTDHRSSSAGRRKAEPSKAETTGERAESKSAKPETKAAKSDD
jgi:putative FmdB family regulatory protein